MNTSLSGLKFIACREALVTRAYADGKHKDDSPKFSIGFGSQTNEPKDGDTMSIEDAFARLKADLLSRDLVIERTLKVSVKQQEHDALSSLFYQAGTKPLRAVADIFNDGKPILAMAAFMQFNSGANGIPTDGHTKRRAREIIMGIDGYYGDISQVAFFDGDPRVVARQFMPFPEGL